MCGIAGLVDCGAGFGAARLQEIVLAMRDTMVHRGPDDAGLWVDPQGRCALGHRRLSIIDLSPLGRQPMGNEDGQVQVSFNGEIYNFMELRAELERAGHRFHSHTDTEILPHLFETMDPSRLSTLDGMYDLAVWHGGLRRLLLARDPFGKKPLYYASGRGWFAFASELHALTRVPGFDKTIDRQALVEYLLLQYVPAPDSIYRQASKLFPGSYLEVDFSGAAPVSRPGRHFLFEAGVGPGYPRERSLDEEADEFRALFREAVRKRLISDVPLGIFLSGGVDSALVAAMLTRELGRTVKSFSIGFEGTPETEHLMARETARHLGTDHQDQVLKADALDLARKLAQVLDEPNGDSSCLPTYLLCEFTRRQVTVALSGDGGDELFGGYLRYSLALEQFPDDNWRLNAPREGLPRSPGAAYVSDRWLIFNPQTVAEIVPGGLPEPVADLLGAWRHALDTCDRPLIHRMRTLDARTYMPGCVLPKVDRMSMQFALEVRCPLLDVKLARFAEGLKPEYCWHEGTAKRLLRHCAAKYLPAEWMARKKMGFGLPSSCWAQGPVYDFAHDVLLSRSSRLPGLLEARPFRKLVERQRDPRCFSIYQLWNLLILELWLKAHA